MKTLNWCCKKILRPTGINILEALNINARLYFFIDSTRGQSSSSQDTDTYIWKRSFFWLFSFQDVSKWLLFYWFKLKTIQTDIKSKRRDSAQGVVQKARQVYCLCCLWLLSGRECPTKALVTSSNLLSWPIPNQFCLRVQQSRFSRTWARRSRNKKKAEYRTGRVRASHITNPHGWMRTIRVFVRINKWTFRFPL